jgi:hypothetical protein
MGAGGYMTEDNQIDAPHLAVTYPNDMWPQFYYDRKANVDLVCRGGVISLRKYPTGITITRIKCKIKPTAGRTCPWCELSVGEASAHQKQVELYELLNGPINKGKIGTHGIRKLIDRKYGGRDDND